MKLKMNVPHMPRPRRRKRDSEARAEPAKKKRSRLASAGVYHKISAILPKRIIAAYERILVYAGLSSPLAIGGGVTQRQARWHTADGLVVFASLDPLPHTQIKLTKRMLHVSMSRADRLPDWAEIGLVRSLFFGQDVDAAMIMPRQSDYINLHEFCLHLWELPVEWGVW